MSARMRSRSRGKKSAKQDEPVAAKQPGEKTSQQKEPPTENPDMNPGQEKEGAPVVQGEEGMEKLGLKKTGGEQGCGPEVKRETPPNPVPAKIPEACKFSIKNARSGVVLFYNIIIPV
uniref:GAGE domain-containing protein n=1 Tax=Suricata suricatta TaxID=37032 RepID=A0A673UHP9_SURSU